MLTESPIMRGKRHPGEDFLNFAQIMKERGTWELEKAFPASDFFRFQRIQGLSPRSAISHFCRIRCFLLDYK